MKEKVKAGLDVTFKIAGVLTPVVLCMFSLVVFPWARAVTENMYATKHFMSGYTEMAEKDKAALKSEIKIEIANEQKQLTAQMAELSRQIAVLNERLRVKQEPL